ncbi:3-oxoacyl-[acyl-carrier-protein] synthase III C-terminal domain-containing protein [Brytella acorum]|uniref:Beta-ketoacyl synthase N-terminal-like domain-containing protein n=1 Tax=Brytella acorum TaxID=2959299 RepID=A0AA35V9A3_9PROT|nr:3-oxoacyl-[acyl-carrier-protein] synthase III C-terminal domain-containing protein [Brytella acorum]CAI9121884.1 beta-ketoacyl synthase N-terminal-like domain-containing protein [Brytella acorum]
MTISPRAAYITTTGQFLPGYAVNSGDIEHYLGKISDRSHRLGQLVLRQNRIEKRYYAIQPDGRTQWTVAALGAAAAEQLFLKSESGRKRVDFLATATTQGDFLVPGLASAIQHDLRLKPLEILSCQSVCASSFMALKSAWTSLQAGEHECALVIGAEFPSRFFRPGFYKEDPSPDAEFLRWTLSDGAGAVLLEAQPATRGLSLRVDWISLRSFADRFAPCMTAGAIPSKTAGGLESWSTAGSAQTAADAGAFQLRQDAGLLHAMLPVWLGELMRLVDENRINIDALDWFVCHYSAHSLREEMSRLARRAGCMIPEEKWFTNLYDKGNMGAASIFVLLDDLLMSGRLRAGQTVLCAVPESGQCLMGFALMTVVKAAHA